MMNYHVYKNFNRYRHLYLKSIFFVRKINCYVNQKYLLQTKVCFPTTDMQTPSPLRSGHIDINDAQCAKKNDGRKISYYIIPRLGARSAQTRPNGAPKILLSSKVVKFAG